MRLTLLAAILVAFGFAAAPLVACAQTPAPDPGSREVTLGEGAQALHGAFIDAGRPGPAVLIIAGSGPTDRDGNSTIPGVRPDTLHLIARGLAAQGISSLRFDKRGIGASRGAAGDEASLRFTTYVDDAASWARYLASQPGVSCVVLLGHSEGSLIAALAAAQVPVCGVISVAGAGRPMGEVLVEQIRNQPGPESLRQQALAIIAELRAGRTVGDVPQPLAAAFRPSVQPYLISQINLDPQAAYRAVHAPVMIIQGSTDLQVSVQDARQLAAARPDAIVVLLSGVNHVLKTATADRAANIAAYADPNMPLADGVMPPIVTFVRDARPAA